METDKNMVNQPQNQQPQQEEKKKRNKFVAWWLGLKKQWKVLTCVGAAAILAGATVGIVFGVKSCSGNGGTKFNGFTINTYISIEKQGTNTLSYVTDPENLSLENATFDFKIEHPDKFTCNINSNNKRVIDIKHIGSGDSDRTNVDFTITLNNISHTRQFDVSVQ